MVILYFLGFVASSNNCLETAYAIINLISQNPYEVHSLIISTLQMRKLRLRDTGSQLSSKIHPSHLPCHRIGAGHKAAQLEVTSSSSTLPEVRCGHVQTKLPTEQGQNGGHNARLSCMKTVRPGFVLLPLLPMNWQMDVPQLGVNRGNKDNTQGLTSDPLSSLIHSILSLFVIAT